MRWSMRKSSSNTPFQRVCVLGTGKQQGQKCHSYLHVYPRSGSRHCGMGICRRGNTSCSPVCLPTHKTSFTTGQCLKPVTSGDGKNSQKLTASAASFQARVLPNPLVSFVSTMACGDLTTLSCRFHPCLALYKDMKNRGCDVVLVLVWKWIDIDVVPALLASPGGVSVPG